MSQTANIDRLPDIVSSLASGKTVLGAFLRTNTYESTSNQFGPARAFDAAASWGEFSWEIGALVDGVCAHIQVGSAVTEVRGLIYKRSTSSGQVNLPPPVADDTLVADSGWVPCAEAGLVPGDGANNYAYLMSTMDPIEVESGYTYVIQVRAQIGGTSPVEAAVGFEYHTVSVSTAIQRFPGWYHASSSTSAWTNHVAGSLTPRLYQLLPVRRTLVDTADLVEGVAEWRSYAAPRPKILDDYEEYLTNPDHMPYVKFPVVETVENGLERMFGSTALPSWLGQLGVDFGNITPEANMLQTLSGNVSISSATLPDKNGEYRYDKTLVNNGYFSFNSSSTHDLRVTDSIIRGLADGMTDLLLNQTTSTQNAYFDHCVFERANASIMVFNKGEIANSYFHSTRGDGIGLGGPQRKVIRNCLIRRISSKEFTQSGVHGDVYQFNTGADGSLLGSTLYAPAVNYAAPDGDASAYDEGTYSTNNVVRHSPTFENQTLHDCWNFGNLLVGCYRLSEIHAQGTNSQVNNIAFVNNQIGGIPYYGSELRTDPFYVRNGPGTLNNVLMWNNRFHDTKQLATPNGIYGFDRAKLSDKMRYLGCKLGVLDIFGDVLADYDLGPYMT